MLAKLNHSTWHETVGNAEAYVYVWAAVGQCRICMKGGGSQVVMDKQGGSRAGDQVFALRQVQIHFTFVSVSVCICIGTLLDLPVSSSH